MELIKDIPFCMSAKKQFKLDLCLPECVDKSAVRKHIKFKSTEAIQEEKKVSKSINTFNPGETDAIQELPDSDLEIERVKERGNDLVKSLKAPFVIFVHGGGWRRGGKQAWKHYLYHDVNFLVAILQWLLNAYRNVGISLAQEGIGCALISYPLTEQHMPYVLVEMMLSYIQSCFITSIGLFSTGFLIYIIPTCGPGYTSWIQVLGESRCSFRVTPPIVLVPLLTNLVILILFTLKRDKFRLTLSYILPIWLVVIYVTLWHNYLSLTNKLILLTLLTFVITQGIILRRRLLRRDITYTDQIRVVARAVQWGKRLVLKSGQFDRERICLMGHSAGGHLVTLAVLTDKYLKEVRCSPRDIKSVISLAGVYDLHCLNVNNMLKHTYLIPNFGENSHTWRRASPHHQVKKSKTTRGPKFLLMTAEIDPVLVKQSHAFSEKLTSAGLECEYITVHGSNHFTIVSNLVRTFGENDQSVLKLIVDFVSKS